MSVNCPVLRENRRGNHEWTIQRHTTSPGLGCAVHSCLCIDLFIVILCTFLLSEPNKTIPVSITADCIYWTRTNYLKLCCRVLY